MARKYFHIHRLIRYMITCLSGTAHTFLSISVSESNVLKNVISSTESTVGFFVLFYSVKQRASASFPYQTIYWNKCKTMSIHYSLVS